MPPNSIGKFDGNCLAIWTDTLAIKPYGVNHGSGWSVLHRRFFTGVCAAIDGPSDRPIHLGFSGWLQHEALDHFDYHLSEPNSLKIQLFE